MAQQEDHVRLSGQLTADDPGFTAQVGFLGQLYGATSTSQSIHVLGIALIGVVVLVATRGRLAHRRTPLARSARPALSSEF